MKQHVTRKIKKSLPLLHSTALAGMLTVVLGMSAAYAEPLVYVPLGSDGKILAIDVATDKIVNTIGGVSAVHGLAETPDGKFLVAGSFEEREAGSAAPQKPAKMSAKDHAAHHKPMAGMDKKAAKTDQSISTVSVITTKDNTIIRRIDVPGAVHHVAISPDGKFAVVTQPGEGTITAIDLGTYKVVATVATGAMPNYALFSSANGRVYVSNGGNNTISEIDPATWTVSRNFTTGEGPGHLALSKGNQNIYVANGSDGTVSEIDVKKGISVRTFNIGDSLHGLDLSDDAKTLFVSAMGQDRLVAVDLKTTAKRSFKMTAPYHLATLKGTGKLYVSSADEPDIQVIDQASLTALGTIAIGGKGHQMALSPGS